MQYNYIYTYLGILITKKRQIHEGRAKEKIKEGKWRKEIEEGRWRKKSEEGRWRKKTDEEDEEKMRDYQRWINLHGKHTNKGNV